MVDPCIPGDGRTPACGWGVVKEFLGFALLACLDFALLVELSLSQPTSFLTSTVLILLPSHWEEGSKQLRGTCCQLESNHGYIQDAKQSLFTCLLVFPTCCFGQFSIWLGGSGVRSGAVSPRESGHVIGSPRGAGCQRVHATTPAPNQLITLISRGQSLAETQSITHNQTAQSNHSEAFKFQIIIRNIEVLFQNSQQNKATFHTTVLL